MRFMHLLEQNIGIRLVDPRPLPPKRHAIGIRRGPGATCLRRLPTRVRPLEIEYHIQMKRRQRINGLLDQSLVLRRRAGLRRLPIEPDTLGERQTHGIRSPVSDSVLISTRTHIGQFLCVKMPIAPATIFQAIAPDAMKKIAFAIRSNNRIALHSIWSIGVGIALEFIDCHGSAGEYQCTRTSLLRRPRNMQGIELQYSHSYNRQEKNT